jgi:hypothetical protein
MEQRKKEILDAARSSFFSHEYNHASTASRSIFEDISAGAKLLTIFRRMN